MEGARRVTFDHAKEMESPRFRAIIRATSGRRKRTPPDIKSFSHELSTRGPRRYPFRKHRGLSYSEDIMAAMRTKFNSLKEDVDSELGIFAGDLVSLLEKTAKEHPEWSVTIEDLLLVTRECAEMSPDEFWLKCEKIVQTIDDRRQELPMGMIKQVHTRMLFILARCSRLLQFEKEGALGESDHVLGLHQLSDLGVYPSHDRILKDRLATKIAQYSGPLSPISPASRDRISSWKKLPSAAEKNFKKEHDANDVAPAKEVVDSLPFRDEISPASVEQAGASKRLPISLDSFSNTQEDSYADQQIKVDGNLAMICRICDLKIPTLHAEDHSNICAVADRCDLKGLSVNERLDRVAEILEKLLESCDPRCHTRAVNHETARVPASSMTEESNDQSPTQNSSSQPSVVDKMECFPEAVNSLIMNELNALPTMLCITSCLPITDPSTVPSSSGSMTSQSPLSTSCNVDIDLLLSGRNTFPELENYQQIHDLLDIVRDIASIESNDYSSLDDLLSCLQDLQEVVQDRKVDALIVETFGRRIEKLLREKYTFLLQQIDDGKTDPSGVTAGEDVSLETKTSHTSRTGHMRSKLKDRTTIEDFEIIKPISRGAFGRVFLAKKRVTGDLFAIKVLKKADMIRKNAVESILAERNILISVRNPFVVRFFYSFTCRENLYLVMEYLNGGDLYSLLRSLGCLDEEMARTYIAELVLALEYLHFLNVIHRDLKPDNLLIAHDGHIKLTDFGLSKVGLINSTDDLSGPDVSSSTLLEDHETEVSTVQRRQKREQRQKQSAIGTPDYLAPEILLGMPHGPTADWWSVGIILFELLVGIPPFNAEHPQKIFDNIMNQAITWPLIPEEMSYEAHDLIQKLLVENPLQRLGATGAGEVKGHCFFKNINWDMLAQQKAAFIPSTEGDSDTSYFACRYTWNSGDHHIHALPNDCNDMTDSSSCCSSPHSYEQDEDICRDDECTNLEDFGSTNLWMNYSFSNFSFKNLPQLASMNYDVIMKNCKDCPEASKTPES